MTATEAHTQLVMSLATFQDLWTRATVFVSGDDVGAVALRRALAWKEVIGDGRVRVRCDEEALAFILSDAPEFARLWPAVFGDVDVPRHSVVALIARAIGQTVSGVQCDRDGSLRLSFESGDALLVDADGGLDWRSL